MVLLGVFDDNVTVPLHSPVSQSFLQLKLLCFISAQVSSSSDQYRMENGEGTSK